MKPLVTRGAGLSALHLFLSNYNETPQKLEVYTSVFRGV
jgi:hypothetical protein